MLCVLRRGLRRIQGDFDRFIRIIIDRIQNVRSLRKSVAECIDQFAADTVFLAAFRVAELSLLEIQLF